MVSFGQKIPKTCKNTFYKNVRTVLCKKPLQKNTKHSRIEAIFNIGHLAKAIANARAIAFARSPTFKIVSFLEYLVYFGAVFFTEQL